MKYQMENQAENIAGAGLSCVFRGICEQFFCFFKGFWQVSIGFLGTIWGVYFYCVQCGGPEICILTGHREGTFNPKP